MLISPYLPKVESSGLQRFIEDDQVRPGLEMNSIQQGFLCSSEHGMFDDCSIAVNPDVRILFVAWDIYLDNSSTG
jgi:hypothetical protein